MSTRLMSTAVERLLCAAVCLGIAFGLSGRADGQELTSSDLPNLFVETASEPAPPPVPETVPDVAAPLPVIGTAECPNYWIVSSRNASQSYDDDCRGGLEYFEHRPDGSLCRTSSCEMASRFIPGAPVCVFVHGSFVAWEDNQNESYRTYQWIRRACPNLPLNVVFFTWPSDRQTLLLAGCELIHRGRQAEYNAFHLACLLSKIPDHHPVCLFGHSYGALMSMAAVHLGAGGEIEGHVFPGSIGCKRIRIILAAAALDHHWLNDGRRYGCALCRTEGVLNLRNRHDLALKSYSIFRPFHRRALGASGVTRNDRKSQTCTPAVRDCDVTALIGCGHLWPNYFEKPQLATMLTSWVYFPEMYQGSATSP